MKKILLPFVLMILMLTGCGNHIEQSKLVIGIDDDFAPISFRNENNALVGFDIELAREACKRLGVTAEFKPIIWGNKREEILSGNIDMIWNGLDITDERKEYMIFSRPYMDDRQVVLIRADSDLEITSEYDLAGKIVGSQAGSTSDDYINLNADIKDKLAAFKTYEKFKDTLEALANGEVEICICDELVARYAVNTFPNQFKLINVKIGNIAQMGIGFPKDKRDLRDKVQAVFDEMVKDGTARTISEKWFHADLIR